MNKIFLASRSRPDIDLPKFLGTYETLVVPLPLFSPDVSLYAPLLCGRCVSYCHTA